MSTTPGNLPEADSVPGAFPSEDAIIADEQSTHTTQNPSTTGTSATGDERQAEKAREFAKQQQAAHTAGGESGHTATAGLGDQSEKAKEFHEQQKLAHTAGRASGNADDKARDFQAQQSAAHTAGGQKTDQYTPASAQDGSRTGDPSHPAQNSEAWTDVSNPETILRNADGAQAPSSRSQLGNTSGTSHQALAAPNSGYDLSSIGSGIATGATALGLAAKDALFAATDAAAPAAQAATQQAKQAAGYGQENASTASSRETVPTGGVVDTASNAAASAKDAAYSAANTAQSYAPSVLGEPTGTSSGARNIASEVPNTVKDSVTRAGESPEAATNSQAVHEKTQMEKELLGQSQSQSHSFGHHQENTKPKSDLASRVKGLTLEEQLMPDSLTPGVAKVMGTENDRSFPLGATDDSSELSSNQAQSHAAGNKLPSQATTGLESREADSASQGIGRTDDTPNTTNLSNEGVQPTPFTNIASEKHAAPSSSGLGTTSTNTGAAQGVSHGTGQGSETRTSEPVKNALPVRSKEEVVSGGKNSYNTLGSGTPSGVQL